MDVRKEGVAGVIQVWLPILTVIIGGVWGLYTYIEAQKAAQQQAQIEQDKLARAREREAQQPFLKMQLDLYSETAQVIGKLVTLDPSKEEWKSAELRYWALFWSELSLVEHEVVKQAMQKYAGALKGYKKAPNDQSRSFLEDNTYILARALREGISSSWSSANK
ncbi:MAG TPA: hypothetical protein VN838_22015 [Bradyrhizobium sp.]|nr:hypothetical protein [Bradyrhizobium sp.]